MKKHWLTIALAVALLPCAAARAQSNPPFPVTLQKQLAARASNYTEVTLDRSMLAFASHFMDKSDDDATRRMIEKLNGVYVRTYEFNKPGQYTHADLESIRRQFETPAWTPMVKDRSKNGSSDSDIYMKMEGNEIVGMFILAAEPQELDFVYISGPISLDDLSAIGGNFGIPKLKVRNNSVAGGKDK
ncbi:MAG: DUF4252 domain-containing protein [Acidobacteriaceae bacterium]